MKVLFFGDSITDALRNRELLYGEESLGYGYVKQVAARLRVMGFAEEDIINRGIIGDRIVDLYARIKVDCWNHKPDFISILIGVNDVWQEITNNNGVEVDRFEKLYRIMIEDTKKALPNVQIMLCEPFVLPGRETESFEKFLPVYDYAAVVKKIANEYGLYFLPLQDRLREEAGKSNAKDYLSDGVHPAEKGAKLIAEEWLKVFAQRRV